MEGTLQERYMQVKESQRAMEKAKEEISKANIEALMENHDREIKKSLYSAQPEKMNDQEVIEKYKDIMGIKNRTANQMLDSDVQQDEYLFDSEEMHSQYQMLKQSTDFSDSIYDYNKDPFINEVEREDFLKDVQQEREHVLQEKARVPERMRSQLIEMKQNLGHVPEHKEISDLNVIKSPNGYYVGRSQYDQPSGDWQPYSRVSDFTKTQEQANNVLAKSNVYQRDLNPYTSGQLKYMHKNLSPNDPEMRLSRNLIEDKLVHEKGIEKSLEQPKIQPQGLTR